MPTIDMALKDKFYQSAENRSCWQDQQYVACLHINLCDGMARYRWIAGYPLDMDKSKEGIRRNYEYTYRTKNRTIAKMIIVVDRNGIGEKSTEFAKFLFEVYLDILKIEKKYLKPVVFVHEHN